MAVHADPTGLLTPDQNPTCQHGVHDVLKSHRGLDHLEIAGGGEAFDDAGDGEGLYHPARATATGQKVDQDREDLV